MPIVLHIAHRDMWEAAAPGGYYKPLSLDSDGFIHCSTIEQTVETANQFFTGQEGLILLCIDTDKLEAEVKYEVAACIGDQGPGLFPTSTDLSTSPPSPRSWSSRRARMEPSSCRRK